MAETKNGVDLIIKDHRTVQDLLAKIRASTDATFKREHLNLVVRELSEHSVVEEQILYPPFRHMQGGSDEMADHSLHEHAEVKEALEALDKIDVNDAAWTTKLDALIKSLNHHIEEEETKVLPVFRQRLTEAELENMGTLFTTLKSLAPTHPHPAAPDTPPFNTIVGPIAAFVDRIRDLGRTFPKTEQ